MVEGNYLGRHGDLFYSDYKHKAYKAQHLHSALLETVKQHQQ